MQTDVGICLFSIKLQYEVSLSPLLPLLSSDKIKPKLKPDTKNVILILVEYYPLKTVSSLSQINGYQYVPDDHNNINIDSRQCHFQAGKWNVPAFFGMSPVLSLGLKIIKRCQLNIYRGSHRSHLQTVFSQRKRYLLHPVQCQSSASLKK